MTNNQHTVMLITNHSGAGGGAEQQLLALAAGVDKRRFRIIVSRCTMAIFQPRKCPTSNLFACKGKAN